MIHLEEEQNFVYQIWPVRYIAPNFSERGKRENSFIIVWKLICMKVLKATTLLVIPKSR
jgi:hypothetical protein